MAKECEYMMSAALVFLGGGFGALSRFYITKLSTRLIVGFPLGTLLANLFGCFLIGLLHFWFIEKGITNENHKALLITGYLGGLTTFSSFQLDIHQLISYGRSLAFLIYIVLNLLMGYLALLVGKALVR